MLEKAWNREGSFYVVRMDSVKEPHLLGYEQVALYAHRRYGETAQDRLLDALLAESRKRHPLKIDLAALRSVRLARVPDTSEF